MLVALPQVEEQKQSLVVIPITLIHQLEAQHSQQISSRRGGEGGLLKEYKDSFPICTKVEWSDVVEKIDNEFKEKTYKHLFEEGCPPTFVLHNSFLPGTLKDAFEEVNKKCGVTETHVYASMGNNSPTFGSHLDDMDVLIVQAIGALQYDFAEEGGNMTSVILNPGDGLFIPKHEVHCPIVRSPRVTLSFSWDVHLPDLFWGWKVQGDNDKIKPGNG